MIQCSTKKNEALLGATINLIKIMNDESKEDRLKKIEVKKEKVVKHIALLELLKEQLKETNIEEYWNNSQIDGIGLQIEKILNKIELKIGKDFYSIRLDIDNDSADYVISIRDKDTLETCSYFCANMCGEITFIEELELKIKKQKDDLEMLYAQEQDANYNLIDKYNLIEIYKRELFAVGDPTLKNLGIPIKKLI